ncbi:tRNA (N6-threonylcarbamoyladenosine(37)-N6)-methyltransferase TrmO [Rhodobacteraceae bacterium RKSG542]|uniref:tRNA (N6-threonylcarbamoyladenosine(37)-N6)-methyltransferase TrmO n=1 Tax=Pseudovibrio flavus TaxID=2529854 RepID=UPI0012BC574E|nr:tRNA (N6-threonylcarbamoyladenosine(37)-N6)-methyltransferase TrmO [Pseudovibrio flavus]MTI16186.1 tRNA (N6-threonylcarbamoyladenosine(37)-N6)-methyltransferase TrmO [Pseudovibrio flavus]
MHAELLPIGTIETPYKTLDQCPSNISPNGPPCTLHLFDEFTLGLMGLESGQYIQVLYWLGEGKRDKLVQVSHLSGKETGTFALRSPHRPNPIGSATCRIEAIEGAAITVNGLDCLNGTMIIDIKPAIMREVPELHSSVDRDVSVSPF